MGSTVHGLTFNVQKLFMDMDARLWEECTTRHKANMERCGAEPPPMRAPSHPIARTVLLRVRRSRGVIPHAVGWLCGVAFLTRLERWWVALLTRLVGWWVAGPRLRRRSGCSNGRRSKEQWA